MRNHFNARDIGDTSPTEEGKVQAVVIREFSDWVVLRFLTGPLKDYGPTTQHRGNLSHIEIVGSEEFNREVREIAH
jgi:hypothetical protein